MDTFIQKFNKIELNDYNDMIESFNQLFIEQQVILNNYLHQMCQKDMLWHQGIPFVVKVITKDLKTVDINGCTCKYYDIEGVERSIPNCKCVSKKRNVYIITVCDTKIKKDIYLSTQLEYLYHTLRKDHYLLLKKYAISNKNKKRIIEVYDARIIK